MKQADRRARHDRRTEIAPIEARQRQPEPSDIESSINSLDKQIAERQRQRTETTASLDAAREAGQQAQQQRGALRLAALGDGDHSARDAYAQASADVRAKDDAVTEYAALLEQLDGELDRLNSDRREALQAKARARLDDIGHKRTLPLMERADALLDELVDVLRQARAAKNEQLSIFAAADLHGTHKRFSLDYVERVLRFKLAAFGATGVRHHAFRTVTLAEVEAQLQGFMSGDEADDITRPEASRSSAANSAA